MRKIQRNLPVILSLVTLALALYWGAADARMEGSGDDLQAGSATKAYQLPTATPAGGDPDQPQTGKRNIGCPGSDGHRNPGDAAGFRGFDWTGRVWATWYVSRWFAR